MKDKIKNILTKNYRLITLFLCTIFFILILENILDFEINKFDTVGYNFISMSISENTKPIAKFITKFGNPSTLILLMLILVCAVKDKKMKLAIPINLACSSCLNFVLKNIIQRPRPVEFRIIDESGYSFPSGHSMVSMAFYGFLIYLIFKDVKNKYMKAISIILLTTLIILIGASRIYLGVHYASDVIGGFLLAISYLTLYTKILKEIK